MKKKVLSLLLALMMCLGLTLPALAAEEPEPELPLADVAVPVQINAAGGDIRTYYDLVRITHAVALETVECEGEPLELYSIYPGARLCKTDLGGSIKWYSATLEKGVLKAGKLLGEVTANHWSENGINWSDMVYLYSGEEDVGNYFIAEVIDTCYTKKVGFRVVEGTLPDSAPVHYTGIVGLSQTARFVVENNQSYAVVPAGTVVTLPYDDAEKSGGPGAYMKISEEIYLCNGRKCFTVEPGQSYEVYYTESRFWMDRDYNEVMAAMPGDRQIWIRAESVPTAYASTQTVLVDDKPVTFECYALKDEKGNATNYIKLRDLAMLLNGSAAQFEVGWDGSVTITTKTAYTPNGSELSTPYSGDREYQESAAETRVNGQTADLDAFVLNDDKGGGYTYYQLRDLGKALGFNVGWSAEKGIFLETDKAYDPNN